MLCRYKAGLKEVQMLNKLRQADPEDKKHVVKLERTFEHRGHLCLVFESLRWARFHCPPFTSLMTLSWQSFSQHELTRCREAVRQRRRTEHSSRACIRPPTFLVDEPVEEV